MNSHENLNYIYVILKNHFHSNKVLKVPTLIQDLLRVNTNMVCIPDSNGNYPLHISIFNQQVLMLPSRFSMQVHGLEGKRIMLMDYFHSSRQPLARGGMV